MAFLTFSECANPGKKTKRWVINSASGSGDLLGWIEFFPAWRKYVWSMAGGVVFDISCTEEVVKFLNEHGKDRQ